MSDDFGSSIKLLGVSQRAVRASKAEASPMFGVLTIWLLQRIAQSHWELQPQSRQTCLLESSWTELWTVPKSIEFLKDRCSDYGEVVGCVRSFV